MLTRRKYTGNILVVIHGRYWIQPRPVWKGEIRQYLDVSSFHKAEAGQFSFIAGITVPVAAGHFTMTTGNQININ